MDAIKLSRAGNKEGFQSSILLKYLAYTFRAKKEPDL